MSSRGRLAVDDAFLHAFEQQGAGDFIIEVMIEPRRQPADLGALERVFRKQSPVALQHAVGLVDEFGDNDRAAERSHVVVDIDGQRAGGIEGEELLALLPGLLFHQIRLEAVFGQNQANETGRGGHRVMIQGRHRNSDSRNFQWPQRRLSKRLVISAASKL